MRKIASAVKKLPLNTSKSIFDEAGIKDIPRSTRCNILNKIAKVVKPKSKPPLTQNNKARRLAWAKNTLRLISQVLYSLTSPVQHWMDLMGGHEVGFLMI